MAEPVAAARRWPWVVALLVLGAVLAAVVAMRGKSPELTAYTRGTGASLTSDQRKVSFDTAKLEFEVFPEQRAIRGHAVLGFTAREPVSRIQFDLDRDLPISAIRIDGAAIDRARWRNPDGRVDVDLGRTVGAGQKFTLAVDYAGTPHVAVKAPWDGGFVWSKTKDGKPWVATAVEGEGCDLFWPCIDNSLVEVGTIELDITVPKGLVAPSNGRLIGVTTASDGRPTYHWRTRHSNNYAVALNIAPYKQISGTYQSRFGNRIPMAYWYLPGEEKQAAALFAGFTPAIDFFEAKIGPYPFGDEKIGVVETPHLGMEHQTINAYGNAYKQAPDGFDWLFQHEFSHEWFGNQLTNRDWDDMWLHEGFGTYMQPLYAEALNGRIGYDAWLWKIRSTIMNRHPIVTGKHRLEHDVYDKKTGPGLDIYNKGAWTLHTLRGLIGDEAFFRSVRRLVYGRVDPRPGNFAPRFGTTNEFVAIVNQESGRDLGWFFDAYLRHARLPLLAQTRVGQRLDLQWRTPGGIAFPMPVEVAVDGTTVSVPMADGRGSIMLPAANSQVTIDPQSKLLRQSQAIDRYRNWDEAEKAKVPAKS